MNTELKSSEDWNKLIQSGITILDPDGWDRKNFHYSWNEERISKKEFHNRLIRSTITQSSKLGMQILDEWANS